MITEGSPDTPDSQSKYSGLPVRGIRTLSFMYQDSQFYVLGL